MFNGWFQLAVELPNVGYCFHVLNDTVGVHDALDYVGCKINGDVEIGFQENVYGVSSTEVFLG